MRVSTGMIYNSGITSMQQRTSSLLRTQQQISSGRRMLTPSDDPVAAARALEVTQSQSINQQYQKSQDNAKSALGIMDGQLSSLSDLLTRVRELTVQGGNATLSASDRQSIATEIRARFDELVGLANSTDGTGQYLFSGYQGISEPFAGSADSGVDYFGDDGMRTLQISGGRHLPISNSGNDIFMNIKNGNGVFVTGIQHEKSANASHVTYEGNANLSNPPATTGSFEMRFWTDKTGTVKTAGQAVGNMVIAPNFSVAAGDEQFQIQLDGAALPTAVTLSNLGPFATPADFILQLQADLDNAVGPGKVIASLDVSDHVVLTSTTQGVPSNVALTEGNGGLGAMFGAVTATAGFNGAAGATYFDLVDAAGKSLYAKTASTAGGAGNTYTHAYASGTPLDLSSAGPYAFDYGVSAILTGIPADGDTFSVNRTNSTVTFANKTFNVNAARATIDAGVVATPMKWKQSANSGDLEVRFWVDAAGTVATSGQAMGNTVIPPGMTVVAGTADQFKIYVDGGGVQTVTVPPGTYATPEDLATAINGAMPAGTSIALDASYRLVVTSSSTGNTSTIALDDGVGARNGLARFFGATQSYTAGFTGTAGTTYYDLVDVANGQSLYNGAQSATGATYTHAYSNVHADITGSVDLSAGFTPAAGVNDTLNLTVNGVARSITIPAGPGAGGLYTFGQLQAQLQKQLGPFGVTVGASGNKLVLSSDTINANYAVTVTAPASNGALALLGAPTVSSQPSGSATIALRGTEATPFDYGASVTISGIPAGGDAFAIKSNTDPALGNGYFTTAAKTAAAVNMGSGIIGTGEVIDKAKWDSPYNSRQLEVRFWKDPEDGRANAPVYYDLVDAETEKSLFTDTTSTSGKGGTFTHVFNSGDAISFSGLAAPYVDFGASLTISGTPASGDVFTVDSSTSKSVFETLQNLIFALESPVGPPGSNTNAELLNKLGAALTGISAAGDNFARVRADLGTRLGEIDDLNSVSSNLELEYASTLSNLQDIDYSKSISDLMRMQMELQAAQQSFTKISQLSLFNYL